MRKFLFYVIRNGTLTGIAVSILLLIGCEDKGSQHNQEIDDKKAFEQDLFTNQGKACLGINEPGNYTITAEFANHFVILSPKNKNTKTTVGAIKSTPLKITVIE